MGSHTSRGGNRRGSHEANHCAHWRRARFASWVSSPNLNFNLFFSPMEIKIRIKIKIKNLKPAHQTVGRNAV